MQFIITHENFLLADYNSGNKLRDNLRTLVLKKKVQTDMSSFKFNSGICLVGFCFRSFQSLVDARLALYPCPSCLPFLGAAMMGVSLPLGGRLYKSQDSPPFLLGRAEYDSSLILGDL